MSRVMNVVVVFIAADVRCRYGYSLPLTVQPLLPTPPLPPAPLLSLTRCLFTASTAEGLEPRQCPTDSSE